MYRPTPLPPPPKQKKNSGREKRKIESPSSVRLINAKRNVACQLSDWHRKMNNDAQPWPFHPLIILGDPGQIVGARESLQVRKK